MSLKMIGSGRLFNGLYILDLPNVVCKVPPLVVNYFHSSTNFVLWYFRLGHVSPDRMIVFPQYVPSIKVNKAVVCDKCHLCKQKKLSFPLSLRRETSPFRLLHMDVWGPYHLNSINNHRFFLTIVDDYSRFT